MTDRSQEPLAGRLSYEDAFAKTGAEVRRILRGAPILIRQMTRHLSRASGKMIRAGALLACAEDNEASINPDAVKAAAAVELLHLATLVHDDILDDADKRRGIQALHKKYGEKYAVLCGDYLFCAALEFASTIRPLEHRKESPERVYPRYLTDICLGELRQNKNSGNFTLTEREYFATIRGKTAALFEASCYAGFLFSDEPDSYKKTYQEIGGNIGLIFQLADDCADYESTRKAAKKPVLSDWSRGVITLPLIRALQADPALSAEIVPGMEPGELKKRIEDAGGFAYTYEKIRKLTQKTKKNIDSLQIVPQKKGLLLRLLERSAGAIQL